MDEIIYSKLFALITCAETFSTLIYQMFHIKMGTFQEVLLFLFLCF